MNSLQLEGSLAGWQQYKCDTLGAAAAAPGWCSRLVQQQQSLNQSQPGQAGQAPPRQLQVAATVAPVPGWHWQQAKGHLPSGITAARAGQE